MQPISKPWWEQVTALISLSVSGAVTGFSFVPKAPAELRSPASMPIHLLAMEQADHTAPADDTALRSAIVNVANYFLRMAATRTPAEMEAIIWQHDSIDGVDHGESCAAFASLTLELAAHAVGQQSWVTGGTSYPWPLHKWADVRVDPNPGSLGVISVLQDAEAHHRWHPLGDGYTPEPGDWVLFDGHVEVVTKYSGGVLYTIGGDSLPNFSVNAHRYPGPLSAQGVAGFVNNGVVPAMTGGSPGSGEPVAGPQEVSTQARQGTPQAKPRIPGARVSGPAQRKLARGRGDAAIPGLPVNTAKHHRRPASPRPEQARASRAVAGTGASVTARTQTSAPAGPAAASASPSIPGLPDVPGSQAAGRPPYNRHRPAALTGPAYDTQTEQAFINAVAPGAIAAQRRYGVPASVTIAQAIDESGWGRSVLATQDNNLFGIKGTGPAGSQQLATSEYQNGQLVPTTSPFRIYHSVAESINDHGKLLATSAYYRAAMASRTDPNAFAQALTGVYATDPQYGTKLISLMQQYNLYRYDAAAHTAPSQRAHKEGARSQASPGQRAPSQPAPSHGASAPAATPTPARTRQPATGRRPPVVAPTPSPIVPEPSLQTPSPAPRPTVSAPGSTLQSPGRQRQKAAPGGAAIPGMPADVPAQPARPTAEAPSPKATADAAGQAGVYQAGQPNAYQVVTDAVSVSADARAKPEATPLDRQKQQIASLRPRPAGRRYQHHIPPSVWTTLIGTARGPLLRGEHLYRDIAGETGTRWEFLAACDWMQCRARPGYSPVCGEKLGSVNLDGTVYHTKSAALEQCANDLAELARTVYHIDITAPGELSVRDLANVFAAFRWGGLLKQHHTSAMEFPYSVAGLTAEHTSMRWPNIDSPHAPDKPGGRFRMPFGAVPIVLSLHYPATV
jgi:flagellum-specific peptidoglycan hydrolase FlgJ